MPEQGIANEQPVIANSLWNATANHSPPFAPLQRDEEADVVIIGGGFTGLSAALHLAEAGKSVCLLEAETPGWGASGRNGGQVVPGLKEDPDEIERRFGPQLGQRMVELSGNAGRFVFRLIDRHGIDCNAFSDGWIQPIHSSSAMETVKRRCAQWQQRGADTRMIERDEAAALLGTDAYLGAMVDKRGGNLHPLNYALGLSAAASRQGARIFANSRAVKVEDQGSKVIATTARAKVVARKALICTNGYSDTSTGMLRRTVVPVRSVQVATAPLPDDVFNSILPQGHSASDTRKLLLYYRKGPNQSFVMGGRGDYSEAGTRRQFKALREASLALFPQLENATWQYHWGGYVAMTASHYPQLMKLSENTWSAMGYNGRGVAMATVLGKVLADAACGIPDRDLDFPVLPVRPIPFYFMRRPAVAAAVAWARFKDRFAT